MFKAVSVEITTAETTINLHGNENRERYTQTKQPQPLNFSEINGNSKR